VFDVDLDLADFKERKKSFWQDIIDGGSIPAGGRILVLIFVQDGRVSHVRHHTLHPGIIAYAPYANPARCPTSVSTLLAVTRTNLSRNYLPMHKCILIYV
jgi:hypothetical protein